MFNNKTQTIIYAISLFIFLVGSFNFAQAKTVRLIKTANDAKVYLADNNRRVHIPNPSVFEAGGYKWGDIKIVSQKEMNSISNTALIKSPIDAKVYFIKDGAKQWIPDEETFLSAGLRWSDIIVISQAQVEFYGETEFKPQSILEIAKPEIKNKSSDVAVNNTTNLPNSSILNNKSVENVESGEKSNSNYMRPDKIKLQEIGKYTHVVPEVSNFSISNTKLFNNGEVYVTKFEVDGAETKSNNYIWKDGVLTPYTETDYLYQKNNKDEKIVYISPSNNPCFLSNGKKTKIPTLGGFSVTVTDMNESGMAVGRSDVSGGGIDGGAEHAFLWYKGVMKDIGTLGGEQSSAEAINNKGQVIGHSNDKNNQGYAFIWENGKMKKISVDGYDFAYANDINDNGLILGKLKTSENNCSSRACKSEVYLKDGQLFYLDPGAIFVDVNNFDEIVGSVEDAYMIDNIRSHYSSDQYSEIADRARAGGSHYGNGALHINGDTIHLDDLVGDESIVFTNAKAINDRGQILASGFNYNDSYSHEYLISLPQNMPPTFRFTVDGDNTVAEESWKSDEDFDQFLKENPTKYKITWTDADPDDDAKISLYYYYNGIGYQSSYEGEGELLISGLSEDSSVDSFVWDMSGYKSGVYYLYAVIEDKAGKRIFDSDRLKVVKKARSDETDGTAETVEVPIQKGNVTPVN